MVNKLSTKSIQYIFDRSYLGIYELRGNDSLDLLNRLSSNKVDDLSINHGESTILTNNKGKELDIGSICSGGAYAKIISRFKGVDIQ